MLVNERRRTIRRNLLAVVMTLGLLLGSFAPATVLAEQPPGDGNPTRARLIELAAKYPGIRFNNNYKGLMPTSEFEAHRQLTALTTVRDSIEAMPTSILSKEPERWTGSFTSVGWRSCNAYLSTAAIFRVYDVFRVRHRVTTTREDFKPFNITSVSDHSTVAIARDLYLNGVAIQADYSELSRWALGPVMEKLSPSGAPHALWGLYSQYDVHFSAGPFTHSVRGVTRGCVIE